ncbi:MAG: thioredoxin [Phycisphaerales bacterium]
MPSENIHEFTDDSFENEVLKSDQPVLVDFWAEWCQPCRMLAPTIDQLATEFDGKVKVGKVNIDDHQQIAMQHQISAIPTVLLFKDGKVQKKFVGMTSKGELTDALTEIAG